MRHSHFAIAPRGDRVYSYRVVEAMAMGSVPVVLADGYVFPFEDVINWTAAAVHVPEADVASLPRILAALPLAHVCEMRVAAFNAYEQYLASPAKWAAAIEATIARGRAGPKGELLLRPSTSGDASCSYSSSMGLLPDAGMGRTCPLINVSKLASESPLRVTGNGAWTNPGIHVPTPAHGKR